MKKRYVAIILLMTLILSACSTSAQGGKDEYEAQACGGIVACHDINEYENYIKGFGDLLPPDFVRWENFAHLGKFCGIGFYDYYDNYWYELSDSNGKKTVVDINHSPESDYKKATVAQKADANLGTLYRISSSASSAVIKRGDCQYVYRNGALIKIVWYSGKTEFSIVLSCVYQKTTDMSSYVKDLISLEDSVANAAFTEITEKLSK